MMSAIASKGAQSALSALRPQLDADVGTDVVKSAKLRPLARNSHRFTARPTRVKAGEPTDRQQTRTDEARSFADGDFQPTFVF